MLSFRKLLIILFVTSFSVVFAQQTEQNNPYNIYSAIEIDLAYSNTGFPDELFAVDALRYSRPFLQMTLGMETSEGLNVVFTNALTREYQLSGNFNVQPGPEGNPLPFENNTVTESYIFFPTQFADITLGRQKLWLGPSSNQSLLISSQIPYVDGIRLDVPLGSWYMTQVIATLENRRAGDEVQDFRTELGGGVDTEHSVYGFEDSIILLSSRRFFWRNELLELGISGQAILTRYNNSFQAGDILPVFSIHNGDVGQNNLSIVFDASIEPVPGHSQYIMLGLDDVNAGIVGVADGQIPTIWAVIAGIEGEFDLPQLNINYSVDGGHTHYLWGSYDDDYYLSRAIYRLRSDARTIAVPLSSPYGPARNWIEASVLLNIPQNHEIGLSSLLLYGDPSVTLFQNYASMAPVYDFLLFRNDLSYQIRLPFGFKVQGGFLYDIKPDQNDFSLYVDALWGYNSKK